MADQAHISAVGVEVLSMPDAGARLAALGVEVLAYPEPSCRIAGLGFEVLMYLVSDAERLQGLALQASNLQGTSALGRRLPLC